MRERIEPKNTRAFAHHESDYRWRTLVQVGNDWTIRGTVWMKNPGSSSPINEVTDTNDLTMLNLIDSTSRWYNFTVDPTMRAIVNLFCERAKAKGEVFRGIIQIFNIINAMSPDLEEALQKFRTNDNPLKSTWQTDVENIVLPVYIGWGDFHQHPHVSEFAGSILDALRRITDLEFLASSGYIHPLYLMNYGATKPR